MDADNSLWFIRHACSMFNLWIKWSKGITKESELLPDELEFVKSINGRFDVKFLDAALTRLGVSQAIDAQPIMSKIPIKYVITSPLRRTLETTRIIFANHPNKEQILIIVNPIILECMEDPGDIPNWTLKTWKPKYDDCGLNYDFRMMSKIN